MTSRTGRRAERGSALILVVLLLLAMTVTSVAIVQLSGQARINAAAQSSHDALVECANAAQAQLWASIAANGKAYYTTPSSALTVVSLRLPDGKELMAPAHIDGASPGAPAWGIRMIAAGTPSGATGDSNATNQFVDAPGQGPDKSATWVTARCRDSAGRLHEVEFAFRFSL